MIRRERVDIADELLVRQKECWDYLIDDVTEEIGYGGAAGGGKSWLGCLWLMIMCEQYPYTRWLMGRETMKRLKETTLNTFFEVTRKYKRKAGRDYVFKQQGGTIYFPRTQSEILLKELKYYPSDPMFDDLGSLEITGGFIDECNQIRHKAKEVVKSRIRYKLDENGLTPKLLLTCNPAKNWIYTEFYLPEKNGTIPDERKFIQALVTDNPKITKHYVKTLRGLKDRALRERLLYGNWDYGDESLVLFQFDAINDIFTNDHVESGKKCITCDVARFGIDKTVILVWSGFRVIDWVQLDKSSVTETAQAVKAQANKHKIPMSRTIVDEDGIGGGVVDILHCVGFMGGKKAERGENYRNLKTQCAYYLAKEVNDSNVYFDDKGDAEVKEQVRKELDAIQKAQLDKEKLHINSKAEQKEILQGKSPDFADAMIMRMAFDVSKIGDSAFPHPLTKLKKIEVDGSVFHIAFSSYHQNYANLLITQRKGYELKCLKIITVSNVNDPIKEMMDQFRNWAEKITEVNYYGRPLGLGQGFKQLFLRDCTAIRTEAKKSTNNLRSNAVGKAKNDRETRRFANHVLSGKSKVKVSFCEEGCSPLIREIETIRVDGEGNKIRGEGNEGYMSDCLFNNMLPLMFGREFYESDNYGRS